MSIDWSKMVARTFQAIDELEATDPRRAKASRPLSTFTDVFGLYSVRPTGQPATAPAPIARNLRNNLNTLSPGVVGQESFRAGMK